MSVHVCANDAGDVIVISSNNSDYGYIRVVEKVKFIKDGWACVKDLSALIMGKVEDLQQFDFKEGQELPGKIQVLESLEPFNKENPDKDIKYAGPTGIACLFEDQIIYRKTVYNENENAPDNYIPHTNGEQIREALRENSQYRKIASLKKEDIHEYDLTIE